LLCLRRQRLQKIDISNTVAFLGYFDYISVLNQISHNKKAVRLKRTAFFIYTNAQNTMSVYYGQNNVPDHLIINHRAGALGD
jgi:hypothetical protein